MALIRSKREDSGPAAKVLHIAGFDAKVVDAVYTDYIGQDSALVADMLASVATTKAHKDAAKVAVAMLNESDARFAKRSNRNRGF